VLPATLIKTCGTQVQPFMQMLEDNARALAAGAKMPFARATGTTSTPDNAAGTALKQVMPRDHA